MTKSATYVKMMSPEESILLFNYGDHPWNVNPERSILLYPARLAQDDGTLAKLGWKPGMPVPEWKAPHKEGIESMMISVLAEDGIVYTGTATRFYDPATFNTKPHKVLTRFELGDNQEVLSLDDRMAQLGFQYSVNEPTPLS